MFSLVLQHVVASASKHTRTHVFQLGGKVEKESEHGSWLRGQVGLGQMRKQMSLYQVISLEL